MNGKIAIVGRKSLLGYLGPDAERIDVNPSGEGWAERGIHFHCPSWYKNGLRAMAALLDDDVSGVVRRFMKELDCILTFNGEDRSFVEEHPGTAMLFWWLVGRDWWLDHPAFMAEFPREIAFEEERKRRRDEFLIGFRDFQEKVRTGQIIVPRRRLSAHRKRCQPHQ